jgi:PST family polysaccharide transporter
VFSTFFELVYQAKQQFNNMLKARFYGILAGLLTIYPLVIYRDIEGVIFNMIIVYFFTFFYLLYTWIISQNFNLAQFYIYIKELKISVFKYILRVILADISRTFAVYGSLLLVRIIIIQKLGDVNAGYYHATLSISNYLNIVLEGFIVYYYPVICAIHDDDKIQAETNINYEILFYLIMPIVFFIGLFSEELLSILYSNEFIGVSFLLSALIGTKLFYLYYYFFSINLLAKNYLKKFILAELIRSIVLVFTSYIFIDYWGFEGAIYGAIVTEFISIFIIWSLKRKIIKFNLNKLNIKNNIYAVLIFLFLLSNVFNKLYMMIVIIVLFIFAFRIRKYLVVLTTIKSILTRRS